MLSRALDLLDQHLYGNLSTAANREALQGINKTYQELSFRDSPVVFHDSDNLIGKISPRGSVEFQRKYPELGVNTYASPEEFIQKIKDGNYWGEDRLGSGTSQDPEVKGARLNILQNYANQPQPRQELIQMSRAFQDYSNSPEGARIYYNQPTSAHRAKAYLKQGFQNVPVYDDDGIPELVNRQFMDKRPYADQEAVNKLYVFGDTQKYGPQGAQALYAQRMNSPQLMLPMDNVIAKAQISPTYYEPVREQSYYHNDYDDMPF